MITDQDVIDLYWCLLGREPENAGTISAFKSYYPTLEAGRRAIFTSAEFEAFYARTTGKMASTLAVALMERAGALQAPREQAPPDEALRRGMGLFFPPDDTARFAVAIGVPNTVRLEDLAPLGSPEAAVLHIAPGFPPAMPLYTRMADGTAVFQMSGEPETVGNFLAEHAHVIDTLYLLDRSAGPHWVDRLRRHFATQAVIVIGPGQAGFDPAAVDASVRAAHHCETPIDWRGLRISQVGGWRLPVAYTPPAESPKDADRAAFPTVALAAIVRNEANCVENMLRSTLPIASYFAVLDTGSTDDTPRRVRDFLAASPVPHAFAIRSRDEFADDFSAMRNAALAMVPDWIDWVLMLDADEVLSPEDAAPLLHAVARAQAEGALCLAMPRYNYPTAEPAGDVIFYPDIQIRLLRLTPDREVYYSGAVHETVKSVPFSPLPLDAHALGGPRGGPHIHHLVRRFRTAAEEAEKQAFYKGIAEKAEEESR